MSTFAASLPCLIFPVLRRAAGGSRTWVPADVRSRLPEGVTISDGGLRRLCQALREFDEMAVRAASVTVPGQVPVVAEELARSIMASVWSMLLAPDLAIEDVGQMSHPPTPLVLETLREIADDLSLDDDSLTAGARAAMMGQFVLAAGLDVDALPGVASAIRSAGLPAGWQNQIPPEVVSLAMPSVLLLVAVGRTPDAGVRTEFARVAHDRFFSAVVAHVQEMRPWLVDEIAGPVLRWSRAEIGNRNATEARAIENEVLRALSAWQVARKRRWTETDGDPFLCTWERFEAMDAAGRRAVLQAGWDRHEGEIQAWLRAKSARWAVFVKGVAVQFGDESSNVPGEDEVEALGKASDAVPFYFARTGETDEVLPLGTWSPCSGTGPDYPDLTMRIGQVGASRLGSESELKGDFDTGAPRSMMAEQEIFARCPRPAAPLKRDAYDTAKGRVSGGLVSVQVQVPSRAWRGAAMPVLAVDENQWDQTLGWYPDKRESKRRRRSAIWGRDLLVELRLLVHLDGCTRRTAVDPPADADDDAP